MLAVIMGNITFDRFHNCFVLIQNQRAATDAEWGAWIEFVTKGAPKAANALRVLVFSAGGSPTAKQRALIHELMPKTGNGAPTAVVTASLVGRTVVGAMSLFNKNVAAFSPKDCAAAFRYLGIATSAERELLEFSRNLHKRIELPFEGVL